MTEQFSVYDLIAIFRRRFFTILFCFLAVMVAVIVAVIVNRPKFESESKLFVRVGRESIGLDPTATITGQVLGFNVERETEINSVAELVKNHDVLEAAVDAIGVDRVLQPAPENFLTPVYVAIDNAKAKLKGMLVSESDDGPSVEDDEWDREEAIEILDEVVSVSAPKASSVISVSSKAFSPQLAQEIAATVVEHYLEAHSKSSRPEGSLEFFQQQASELRDRVSMLRDELAKRHVDDGIVSLDSQFSLLGTNKAELESRIMSIQGEREAAAARKRELEKALTAESQTVVLQEIEGGLGAPSTGMRRQLFDLEIQASQMLSRLQPNHPTVMAINEQIKELREIVGEQQGVEEASTTLGLNPAWQQLQVSLATETATLAAHEAALEAGKLQLAKVNSQVAELNQRSRDYEELEREIQMAEINYRRYAESLERARIDTELETNNITNVTVAQKATLDRKPIFPDKKTILILGTALAAMFGGAMALLAEFLDRSLRKPEELEEFIGLPVIASVPKGAPRNLVKV